MFCSTLLLVGLTSLPAQPAVQKALTPEEEMKSLYQEECRIWRLFDQEKGKLLAQCSQARNKGAGLGARLIILRQLVRLADESAMQSAAIGARFELAYICRPDKALRDTFYRQYGRLYRYRSASRMLVYLEVRNHRWPWEGKGSHFNHRCLDAIAKAFGMQNELERFLKTVGTTEAVLSDLSPVLLLVRGLP